MLLNRDFSTIKTQLLTVIPCVPQPFALGTKSGSFVGFLSRKNKKKCYWKFTSEIFLYEAIYPILREGGGLKGTWAGGGTWYW